MKSKLLIYSLILIFITSYPAAPGALAVNTTGVEKAPPGNAVLPGDLTQIQIPAENGKIEEVFQVSGQETGGMRQGAGDEGQIKPGVSRLVSRAPFVVLIQDAHAIPQAQKNIQKLIGHFQSQYGIKLIGVEGASSQFDPQIFRSFPDQELLKKTFEGYSERGELTGSAAAAIFPPEGDNEVAYHGVEDWTLYEQGLALYLAAMEKEPDITSKLAVWEKELEEKKRRFYSKELLEIDKTLALFWENKMNLPEALKVLSKVQAPEKGSEIEMILKESEYGEKDQAAVEAEVREIAEKVRLSLRVTEGSEAISEIASSALRPSRNDIAAFNQKYQEFQTSRITPQAFALYLKEFIESGRGSWLGEKGTGNTSLPVPFSLKKAYSRLTTQDSRLVRVIESQKRLRDIQGTRFFADFEAYANSVKGRLLTTDQERVLDRESRNLILAKRLAHLELSRKEWEEAKSWTKDQRPETSDLWSLIRGKLIFHEAFYQNAEQRDMAFLTNLTGLMSHKEKSPVSGHGSQVTNSAILVAGGFHTEGLVQRLKEKNISYVLLTPRINALPENSHYREQMRGEVSWRDYFEVESGKINLYKAFVRAVRDRLLGMSRESWVLRKNANQGSHSRLISQDSPQLLKAWRDQIIRDLAQKEQVAKAGQYTTFIDEVTQKESGDDLKKRLERVNRFIERLQDLEAKGQLTEQNILQLFRPAAIPSVTGVGLAAADFVDTQIEIPGMGLLPVLKLPSRRTAAAQPRAEVLGKAVESRKQGVTREAAMRYAPSAMPHSRAEVRTFGDWVKKVEQAIEDRTIEIVRPQLKYDPAAKVNLRPVPKGFKTLPDMRAYLGIVNDPAFLVQADVMEDRGQVNEENDNYRHWVNGILDGLVIKGLYEHFWEGRPEQELLRKGMEAINSETWINTDGALARIDVPYREIAYIYWLVTHMMPRGTIEEMRGYIEQLIYPDARLRWEATLALGRIHGAIGISTGPALIHALRDGNAHARSSAAFALGWISLNNGGGMVSAVPALVQALVDEDVGVRSSAANALGWIGRNNAGAVINAVPALIQALQDKDARVRRQAEGALYETGRNNEVRQLMHEQAMVHANESVRAELAEILRYIEPRGINEGPAARSEVRSKPSGFDTGKKLRARRSEVRAQQGLEIKKLENDKVEVSVGNETKILKRFASGGFGNIYGEEIKDVVNPRPVWVLKISARNIPEEVYLPPGQSPAEEAEREARVLGVVWERFGGNPPGTFQLVAQGTLADGQYAFLTQGPVAESFENELKTMTIEQKFNVLARYAELSLEYLRKGIFKFDHKESNVLISERDVERVYGIDLGGSKIAPASVPVRGVWPWFLANLKSLWARMGLLGILSAANILERVLPRKVTSRLSDKFFNKGFKWFIDNTSGMETFSGGYAPRDEDKKKLKRILVENTAKGQRNITLTDYYGWIGLHELNKMVIKTGFGDATHIDNDPSKPFSGEKVLSEFWPALLKSIPKKNHSQARKAVIQILTGNGISNLLGYDGTEAFDIESRYQRLIQGLRDLVKLTGVPEIPISGRSELRREVSRDLESWKGEAFSAGFNDQEKIFISKEVAEKYAPKQLLLFDQAEQLGLKVVLSGGTARDFAISWISQEEVHPKTTDYDLTFLFPRETEESEKTKAAFNTPAYDRFETEIEKIIGKDIVMDRALGEYVDGGYGFEHLLKAKFGSAFSVSRLAVEKAGEQYIIFGDASAIEDLRQKKLRVWLGEDEELGLNMTAKMMGKAAIYEDLAGFNFVPEQGTNYIEAEINKIHLASQLNLTLLEEFMQRLYEAVQLSGENQEFIENRLRKTIQEWKLAAKFEMPEDELVRLATSPRSEARSETYVSDTADYSETGRFGERQVPRMPAVREPQKGLLPLIPISRRSEARLPSERLGSAPVTRQPARAEVRGTDEEQLPIETLGNLEQWFTKLNGELLEAIAYEPVPQFYDRINRGLKTLGYPELPKDSERFLGELRELFKLETNLRILDEKSSFDWKPRSSTASEIIILFSHLIRTPFMRNRISDIASQPQNKSDALTANYLYKLQEDLGIKDTGNIPRGEFTIGENGRLLWFNQDQFFAERKTISEKLPNAVELILGQEPAGLYAVKAEPIAPLSHVGVTEREKLSLEEEIEKTEQDVADLGMGYTVSERLRALTAEEVKVFIQTIRRQIEITREVPPAQINLNSNLNFPSGTNLQKILGEDADRGINKIYDLDTGKRRSEVRRSNLIQLPEIWAAVVVDEALTGKEVSRAEMRKASEIVVTTGAAPFADLLKAVAAHADQSDVVKREQIRLIEAFNERFPDQKISLGIIFPEDMNAAELDDVSRSLKEMNADTLVVPQRLKFLDVLQKVGLRLQQVDFSRSVYVGQDALPVAVFEDNAGLKMNEMFVPFKARGSEKIEDYFIRAQVRFVQLLSTGIAAQLLKENPKLKDDPAALKAELLTVLGPQYANTINPDVDGFNVNALEVRVVTEYLARAEIRKAA